LRFKTDGSQLSCTMHPKNISIAGYSYDLPEERIAHYPLTERDGSKLLIYRDGQIREGLYRHIGDHLPENSLLVFNNTKVIEARIVFQKPSGARIEIFCLEPAPEYGNITAAMLQTGRVFWKCLIGGASKWKPGQVLRREVGGEGLVLEARWLEKLEGCFLIELSWSPSGLSFVELLHRAGLMPLPPYIHRAAEQSDQERYQTVYARHDGSVAAPTAGLHFTEAIFQSLEAKNIQKEFVTLHVGAGTFMPVKGERLEQHIMHSEFIIVEQATVRKILDNLRGNVMAGEHAVPGGTIPPGLIIPVGTTSLRTIESLYWLGIRAVRDPETLPAVMVVGQWDPYEDGGGEGGKSGPGTISPQKALQALLEWMERRGLQQLLTRTQLLITPGYDWKITGALVTNFHQPGSTLLLLVAALIGEDWKKVYRYALDHSFRFLSYGDGCLLFRGQ
jgi:S-adenosylmethionine:tRNA ribosyltransferase-isomerase